MSGATIFTLSVDDCTQYILNTMLALKNCCARNMYSCTGMFRNFQLRNLMLWDNISGGGG